MCSCYALRHSIITTYEANMSHLNDTAYDTRPWRQSYTREGRSHELAPLQHANVAALLRESASRYPQHTAFTVCLDNGLTGSLSYAQVEQLSDAFAAYLRETLKLQAGDRVAVQLPNCLAYPIAAFGIMKAGCVLVNVNPLYTPPEMLHQFNDAGARVLIMIDLFADKLAGILPQTPMQHVLLASVADFFPLATRCLVKTVLRLKKQIPQAPFSHRTVVDAIHDGRARKQQNYTKEINHSAPAVLQYTGGTTGISKGAILTQGNILSNVAQIAAAAAPHVASGHSRVMTALPIYHIFAFSVSLLYMYSNGTHNVLIPSPRPINKTRKAFEKFQFDVFSGLNILFNALLNEEWFRQNPPRSMVVTIAGGAALHKSVAERWHDVVGHPLYEGYGMTEASPVVSVNPIGGQVKLGSVGVPLPGTDVRIVDDNGNCVPLGEIGEIVVRGPQVMAGYWQRPDETAKVLKNGWLFTGDIGRMDEEGYIFIVDRKKDMIIVNGFNVYPNEIEDCISHHPDVAEVAVVGEPNEATGESVVAYIVRKNPQLSEDAVREHCKTMLTNYKVPRKVHFRNDLPKSPVGKILRKDLRKTSG
jgi:long-chain acyl-CoA synthetase